MKNFNNKLKEILFVSKITEIKNKKLTVSFSIFLTNIGVLSDILIIVIFAVFLKMILYLQTYYSIFLLKGVIYFQ